MSKKLSYNPSDFVCNITIEEKLRRVPEDAEWWVHQWSTSDYFDIGSICFEALAKLNAQKSEIDSLYYENSMLKNRHRLQQAEIEALKEPREIIIKDNLYLINVLPDGGIELRFARAILRKASEK